MAILLVGFSNTSWNSVPLPLDLSSAGLTGCPLRCQYCDTAYAFHGGQWWEIDAILAEVERAGSSPQCAPARCPSCGRER